MTQEFKGTIHIFHAFDIGEDLALEQIRNDPALTKRSITSSKYFKNYHQPLGVELPHPDKASSCKTVKLHPYGVISFHYEIPFTETLDNLKKNIEKIDNEYEKQSENDASTIYNIINKYVKNPVFFHISRSYLLIQLNTRPDLSGKQLEDQYGGTIASLLRFEEESLSEFKKNEILERAFGYFRGDLIVIDTEAAFLYDDEYEEVLDLFEFVNIQHLELQYFDRVLDKQLTKAYNRGNKPLSLRDSLPIIGSNITSADSLAVLKVDISVITERLESSIKLIGEPYYSELYSALTKTLDLANWKESIERKLSIVQDLSEIYESRAQTNRDNMFNVLITILIFMELVVAIIQYFRI